MEVRGISVNPVDVKVRENMQPDGAQRILGFDAAGIVKAVGSATTQFKPGDEVFYAGDFTRPGSNAEFQLVDERIVGRKPSSLGFAEAAGIPLTTITAWEILFDNFALTEGEGDGRRSARDRRRRRCRVHPDPVGEEAHRPGGNRDRVASGHAGMGREDGRGSRRQSPHPARRGDDGAGRRTAVRGVPNEHRRGYAAIVELIKPRGRIALIDDPRSLDIIPLKTKALTVGWEFMFTRSMFQTEDMDVQHELLNRVADLLDDGTLVSTVNEHVGAMNVANLRRAHELQESGAAIGKTVLDGLT